MTANSGLYRELFSLCSGGMGFSKGPSPRYELKITELMREQWQDLCVRFGVTDDDINSFYLAARGNYIIPEKAVETRLLLSDILAGETLSIVFSTCAANHNLLKLLKLDDNNYLVLSKYRDLKQTDVYTLSQSTHLHRFEETDMPAIGKVKLSAVFFHQPTIFHYTLDSALLPNYRRTETATSIMPIIRKIKNILPDEMTKEQLHEILVLAASLGVSTFTIRQTIDTYTSSPL